jgi:AraC-like DNA-binding protein
MRYAQYAPSPRLAGLVECYWILEGIGTGTPEPIIPDGRAEIILHYGVRFDRHHPGGRIERQAPAMLVGQILAPPCIAHTGMAGVAAIRLRPEAVAAAAGCPAPELTGWFVELEAVFGSTACLRERLAAAGDDTARVGLLEAWFASAARAQPDARTAAIVRAIAARAGNVDIAAIARDAGVSVRHLERRFLADVGVTPKAFARLARLQAALGRVSAGEPLADVAVACGYYDQPHMARDFSRLAETSPAAWRQQAGVVTPLFVNA